LSVWKTFNAANDQRVPADIWLKGSVSVSSSTTEVTEITEKIPMFYVGVLPRNTKFNAETAEAAEKNASEALRSVRALRSNVVISSRGVPARDARW